MLKGFINFIKCMCAVCEYVHESQVYDCWMRLIFDG